MVPYVEAQGARIPALGLGTWQLRGRTCREAVAHALSIGYRHLDTARNYRNETEVGAGLRDSGVDRGEVFVTTKVPGRLGDRSGVRREVEASLRELRLEQIDLLLLHQPAGIPVGETMTAFREEQEAGRVRYLGVSNYSVPLLREAIAEAPIVTVQNEYHPDHPQDEVLAWCRANDVVLTAYSPLAVRSPARRAALARVAERYDRTPAQVVIRWLLQQEKVITIPRSRRADHREQNLDVFDFELTEDEMGFVARGA